MDKRIKDLRLQHWAEIIREANNSGLSKSEWCRQNNIKIRKFFYWQKALRERLLDQGGTSEDDICLAQPTPMLPVSEPDFFEITSMNNQTSDIFSTASKNGSSIEMRFGNFSFRIDDSSSEAALEKIIRILSRA